MIFRNGRYETKEWKRGDPIPVNEPYRVVDKVFLDGEKTSDGQIIRYGALGNGSGLLDRNISSDDYKGYVNSNYDGLSVGGTMRRTDDCVEYSGGCAEVGVGAMSNNPSDWEEMNLRRGDTACLAGWGYRTISLGDTGDGVGIWHIDIYRGTEPDLAPRVTSPSKVWKLEEE